MGLITALEAVQKINNDIYVITYPDETEVLFRLPPYKEASQYATLLSVAEGNGSLETIIYNHIFEACVTDDYLASHDQNLKAGIPETTAKVILHLSGVGEHFKEYTESLLEIYRNRTGSILSIMKRTICQVFAYKLSDVDNMTFQQMVEAYVNAEQVLLEQGIIQEGLKFAEPEKEKPFTVENMISKDTKEYERFETPEVGPRSNIKEDHAYKAKMEEFRIKQKLRRGG